MVDDRAKDDVGVVVGFGLDELGRLVDLEETEVLRAGDVEQHPRRALDRLLDQRRGDRGLGGVDGTRLTRGGADAHQGRAGVAHDRAHVGEVEVDQAGDGDQVGDALHALAQDVVGLLEGLEHASAPLDRLQKLLVGNDDQGVDVVAQLLDSLERLLHAPFALELERLGDRANGQRADLLLGDLGDDRGRAGAGAATLAGGDEDHVGALQRLLDLIAALRRGARSDLRVAAGAEAAGELLSDRELDVRFAGLQRLCVGVDRDELDAANSGVDHAADGIGASAAGTDDLYHREVSGFHLPISPSPAN